MATIEELTAAAQTAIDDIKTANGGDGMSVSYTHLTLPTNREV